MVGERIATIVGVTLVFAACAERAALEGTTDTGVASTGSGESGDGDTGDGDTGDGDTGDPDCEPAGDDAWWTVVVHDGVDGPVDPDPADLERVALHLCWLRQAEPELAELGFSSPWEPTQMIVGLVPNQSLDEYDALNLQYGLVSQELLGFELHLLTFSTPYNIPALALIYAQLPAVDLATVNGIIGISGTFTSYAYEQLDTATWRWGIESETYYCYQGCPCVRTWTYDVDHDAGIASFVEYGEAGDYCEDP